jgi:hypothetical protein
MQSNSTAAIELVADGKTEFIPDLNEDILFLSVLLQNSWGSMFSLALTQNEPLVTNFQGPKYLS